MLIKDKHDPELHKLLEQTARTHARSGEILLRASQNFANAVGLADQLDMTTDEMSSYTGHTPEALDQILAVWRTWPDQ